MQFTTEQLAQFREQGFLAVPNFWTPREIEAMQAELKRLKDDGLIKNIATDDGQTLSQSFANLQLCPMFPHSVFFRAMPFAPKVIEAVSQLLGNPILLHLDQVFIKPGRHGAGTNWHQDNAYFKISDPLMGTALWTAVHDANLQNGTMRVIPGSFCQSYEHSRDPHSNHHIRCYPPEENAVPIELAAGGALFFAYGVAHATGANNTERERAGIALHFLRADYAQNELIEANRDTRPYLTGERATGGQAEYGVRVAGTWEQEVEKTLNAREAVTA